MAPKSEVWNHWTAVGSKKEAKAQCKRCNKVYSTSQNTSNLWTHLRTAHKIFKHQNDSRASTGALTVYLQNEERVDDPPHVNADVRASADSDSANPSSAQPQSKRAKTSQPVQQPTLKSTFNRASSFQEGGSRSAAIEDALLYMTMKDNLCLSTPMKPGFRYFVRKTVPLWKPPSRTTLTTRMETKYEVLSEVVRVAISRIPAVCLTADNWTDRGTNNSFLGVTVHYPKEDEMETAILGVVQLTESHTADYLSGKLHDFCVQWGIDDAKVKMVVTDNAENITLAVKKRFGNDRQLNCFDHTLNLIPKFAIGYIQDEKENGPHVPGVPELLNKVKKIVTYSHTSNNFADELKRIQRERGKTEGTFLRLIQEVKTRWSSAYAMCQRFLEMSEIVTLASLKFPDLVMLTGSEMVTLRMITDMLFPFSQATTEMSAEKVTSASKVIPMIYLLNKKLATMQIAPTATIARSLNKFLLSELERRFKDVEFHMPLAIATMMDTRFLKIYFQKPVALANTLTKIEEFVRLELRNEARVAERVAAETAVVRAAAQGTPGGSADNLWDSHDALITSAYAAGITDDLAGRARTEVRAFLGRPPTPRNSNPLKTWSAIKHEYPHVYKLAMKYLPIAATSVPSERLFSLTGRILDDDGNRLTPAHLSQRVFLSKVDEALWESVL